MDLGDIMSSQSQDQNGSINSQGRETISTQTHKTLDKMKTKNIKKKYQPLIEGGKVFKYQDNPSEYKKMRKKIQNRESATRVRGRKKYAFQNLQQEVEYLRKENSQLQLSNAKLQTQNKYLKDQVQFMKTIIKPASNASKDPIDDYLNSEVLTHNSPQNSPINIPVETQNSQGFFEEFNWIRTDSSESNNYGWVSLTIFTIILGIFIIPNNEAISFAFVAKQEGEISNSVAPLIHMQLINTIINYCKIGLKYGIILLYLCLMYKKIKMYWRRIKSEKNE